MHDLSVGAWRCRVRLFMGAMFIVVGMTLQVMQSLGALHAG